MPKGPSFLAALIIWTVASACQGAVSVTPGPTAASPTQAGASSPPPTTVPASPTASTSPSPTATGPIDLPHGTLAAGTYKSVNFGLPISFTVAGGPEGWAATDDERGLVTLGAARNLSDQLGFSLPTSFGQSGKGLFESLKGLKVDTGAITSTTVDGLPAESADFHVGPTEEGFGLNVFTVDGGTWFTPPGNHLQLTLVDRGDGLFLIVVDVAEGDWSKLKPNIDSVISSLHFE